MLIRLGGFLYITVYILLVYSLKCEVTTQVLLKLEKELSNVVNLKTKKFVFLFLNLC